MTNPTADALRYARRAKLNAEAALDAVPQASDAYRRLEGATQELGIAALELEAELEVEAELEGGA